jgi:uncharacterized protein (TIGR03067 family)
MPMKSIIFAGLCAGTILLVATGLSADKPGSSTAEKARDEKAARTDETAMQGNWKGRSVNDNPQHQVVFVISGKNFDFRDETETNNWYKGTFTLREDISPRQFIATITECPFPQYVGKTSKANYKIEKSTLTIAANEPGKEGVPQDFDAEGAACIEVTKK